MTVRPLRRSWRFSRNELSGEPGAVQALAARFAAANRTPGQLARIQALQEGFVAAAEKLTVDPASLARMNIALYRAICEAERNVLLAEFLGRIYDVVVGLGTTTYSRPGRPLTQAFRSRLVIYREAQVSNPL